MRHLKGVRRQRQQLRVLELREIQSGRNLLLHRSGKLPRIPELEQHDLQLRFVSGRELVHVDKIELSDRRRNLGHRRMQLHLPGRRLLDYERIQRLVRMLEPESILEWNGVHLLRWNGG